MKKNILICANDLCIGGIEKSLINLLKSIDKEKYKIDLLLEKKQGELLKEVPSDINIIEYTPYLLNNKIIQKFLNYIKLLSFKYKNYHKYNTSICYATYSYPDNKISRLASKNAILFIHSDYTNLYNKEELKQFFNTRKINNFKSIVFVSKESKDNLIKIYPEIEDKSVVINNIIDIESITKLSKEKIELPYDKSNINLLFVGRLEEKSKNIMFQLESIYEIKKRIKNIKLYIIGDGPDKSTYYDYVKDNKLDKTVIFLGQKTNPYPYIKNCDYLLLTSNYEGYPVIFNEGLVLNKEIISTIKISDEYLTIGDNFGFLINKKDFVNSLVEIINNKLTKKTNADITEINKKRIRKIEMMFDEE